MQISSNGNEQTWHYKFIVKVNGVTYYLQVSWIRGYNPIGAWNVKRFYSTIGYVDVIPFYTYRLPVSQTNHLTISANYDSEWDAIIKEILQVAIEISDGE